MSQQTQYASDQPQGYKNYVEHIAIVGAGGRVGSHIAQSLLKTNRHKVTALTRPDSSSKLPEGVIVKNIDYDDQSSLVEALKGQDVLIITMAVTAPPGQEAKLIEASAEAGVPWVMPNEWGGDLTNEALANDTLIGAARTKARNLIQSLGKSSYISLVCGFWYEFSLAGQAVRYGFDFPSRTVTFFDDGETKINTSTWEQCGRAVASACTLKVLPDDADDKSPCLSHFRNKGVYISSFLVSQKDMFQSVLRVTGASEKDWAIKHEDVKERYKNGMAEMQKGNMMGFAQLLYSRVFYPDGSGDYESKRGLDNEILGLPKEDLDERTKIAVEMAAKGEVY